MDRIILSARNITKNYIIGGSVLNVLNGIDIDLVKGRILAIVGASGAGKSTLLHILGMLDRPTSGDLILDGENLIGKSEFELASYRNRKVGFIFQFHHLLPEFNALENVMMPAIIQGKNGSNIKERAKLLLDEVGLAKRLTHRPGELSGGELQRVAVARALMNDPLLVLADEPSGNLDRHNSDILHGLILNLAREHKSSFILVTHDLSLAEKADTVVLLSDGKAEEVDLKNTNERLLFKSV